MLLPKTVRLMESPTSLQFIKGKQVAWSPSNKTASPLHCRIYVPPGEVPLFWQRRILLFSAERYCDSGNKNLQVSTFYADVVHRWESNQL